MFAWALAFSFKSNSVGSRQFGSEMFRDADGTVSFSDVFSYDADAQAWTWQLDNVRKDGTRVPFGRVRLTRE